MSSPGVEPGLSRHVKRFLDCNLVRKARRPRGPMDKASAYGAGDCRFESYRGHLIVRGQEMHNFMGGQSRHV